MICVSTAVDDLLCITLHRKCFPSACRPIDKYGAVLPIQKRIAQHAAVDFRKNALLGGVRIEHLFKLVDFLVRFIDSITIS